MPVVTIADYNRYQSPQHPFTRTCPNIRTCWPGLVASYNPFVKPSGLAQRRVAFVVIQMLQLANLTVHLRRSWLLHVLRLPTAPSELPWLLSSLLFFFFVAWNLSLIVRMEGSRKVLGMRFSRAWFDAFLWGLVVSYAALLEWRVMDGVTWSQGVGTIWVVLDLAIFGVAWVSTWEPESVVMLLG